MIGLYDWDLATWKQPLPFNLELMKMATKLKQEQKHVRMITSIDLDRLEHLYIFKENEDGIYPEYLATSSKVTYIGKAISENTLYQNDLQDFSPDTTVYETMKRYYNTSRSKSIFTKMLRAKHIRLLDKNGMLRQDWKLFYTGNGTMKTLIVHDEDITSNNDIYVELKSFLDKNTNYYIGFKYPLILHNQGDLLQWIQLPLSQGFRKINLDFVPSTYFVGIPTYSKADYVFDTTNLNLSSLFLTSLHLLSFGNTVQWIGHDELNQYFSYYIRERAKTPSSFYEYVKYRLNHFTKDEKVRLFNRYKSLDTPLFDLFFSTEYVEMDDGVLVNKMFTFKERRSQK